MARVDDPHAARLAGLDVEAVGEPVALELAEQSQARRALEDRRADEGRAVADDEDVEVGGESRQLRLGPGSRGAGSPRPEATEKAS